MNQKAKYQQQKKKCVDKLKQLAAILADDDLDDEKEATVNGEIEAVKNEIAALDKKIELEEMLEEQQRTMEAVETPSERAAKKAAAEAQINVGDPNFTQDPKKGFKSHTEFLTKVVEQAGHGGQSKDERIRFLQTQGSDEQGVYSDPHGGVLVPVAFSPTPMELATERDILGSRVTPVPMEAPSVGFNARVDKNHTTSVSGGLSVSRRFETQTGSTSRMEFEKVTLQAHELFGAAYATQMLLNSSPVSFAAILARGFGQEFTSHLINERINGTGVGQFEGVRKCPAMVTVNKETSQTADTINYDNILKMRAQCWGYGDAVWIANHDTLPEVAKISDANGNNIFHASATQDIPDILMGRPIVFSEYPEKLGDLGDILLLNMTQYLEGTYQAMQSGESIHVRFLANETCFKFWMMNDARSWWRAKLTPKKGANQLSPFVQLAARA